MAKPPLGIRNNNPGNLEPGGFQGELGVGDGGRFSRFDQMSNGIRALAKNLLAYYDKHTGPDGTRIDTVEEAVSRWAPGNENNTEAYIAFVCRALEVGRKDKLDFRDFNTLWWFVFAIGNEEQGPAAFAQYVSDDDITAGVQAALA